MHMKCQGIQLNACKINCVHLSDLTMLCFMLLLSSEHLEMYIINVGSVWCCKFNYRSR